MDFMKTEAIYRAEGNANVVVNLPEYQKILRLQKAPVSQYDKDKNEINLLDIKKRFEYMNLLNKFFGSSYSCKLEIIHLNECECNRLNTLCTPFRPINRLEKNIIGQSGLLMSDATLISDEDLIKKLNSQNINLENILSVEIKPKQGFKIQEIQHKIPDLFQFNALNKCRYCCMQYLKLKQSKIHKISKFCPMDLYSGDINKIIPAIDALLECPQNNLRVFKNGIQCYGDYKNSLTLQRLYKEIFESNEELFKKLIATCLLNPYKTESNEIENNKISCKLPKGCVLHTLLSMQTLTKDNIAFLNHKESKNDVSYEYLPELLKKNSECGSIKNFSPKEKYMIGATALDSSIMITWCEIKNFDKDILLDLNNFIEVDNRIFITQVKILDIDPKTDNHFQKYVNQTNKAYCETFSHMNEELKKTLS